MAQALEQKLMVVSEPSSEQQQMVFSPQLVACKTYRWALVSSSGAFAGYSSFVKLAAEKSDASSPVTLTYWASHSIASFSALAELLVE